MTAFNTLVQRQGLIAYLDDSGRCYLRSTAMGVSTATFPQLSRPLSQQEIEQRQKLAAFLEGASEDDFIEKVLVPLFQRLGFRRVSPTGHKDKSLEFGKDLFPRKSSRRPVLSSERGKAVYSATSMISPCQAKIGMRSKYIDLCG